MLKEIVRPKKELFQKSLLYIVILEFYIEIDNKNQ